MELHFSIKEILSAFMVLFAVIDITGSTPVIIGLKDKGLKVEPGKAAILSTVIFLLFLFLGDAILSLFGVDIQSFGYSISRSSNTAAPEALPPSSPSSSP